MAREETARRDIESLCRIVGSWPKRELSQEELLATYKGHYSFRGRKEVLLVLDAMRKKYGQGACKVIEQVYYRIGREDGQASKVKHGSLLKMVVDISTRPYCYQIEHCQTGEQRIAYRVVKCPFADLMREMGLEEIGISMCPAYHEAFAKVFGYRFSMPKFLLNGDDCCEHIWEREERGKILL